MFAEPLVTSLNVLVLALMIVVSLVGTAALVKFIAVLFERQPRSTQRPSYDVEDA